MLRSIIATTLLFTALRAEPVHYLIPDQASDALYAFKQLIRSAQEDIVIITPRLESRQLRRSLEKSAAANVSITLLTSYDISKDAAYLAQFKNIAVKQISGLRHGADRGELRLTLLLVDTNRYCSLSMPLVETEMSRDIALAVCAEDDERSVEKYVQTLRSRAKEYLQ